MAENQTWWEKWKEVVTIGIIALVVGVLYVVVLFGNIDLSNDGIVLGFFGILATFVVIGNYAQVINIKSETKQDIDKINDETKTTSLAYKVNELYGANGRPKYEEEIDTKVKKAVEDQIQSYNLQLKTVFDLMLNYNHPNLLKTVLSKEEYSCWVKRTPNSHKSKAWIKLERGKIVFRDRDRNTIESIFEVEDKPFDLEAYNKVVHWWLQNDKIAISMSAQNLVFTGENNEEN